MKTKKTFLVVLFMMALGCGGLAFGDPEPFPIYSAVQEGDVEKIKALLKDNPELVNSKELSGMTPLHWAALHGRKEVVELLLTNKAEVNAMDGGGETPLHHAATWGYTKVAELLLAYKAEVNARKKDGGTPLHRVASKEVAKLFLANKADINAKNNGGDTPLHFAAGNGHKEITALLLANNAEINAKDKDNKTPLAFTLSVRQKVKDWGGLVSYPKGLITREMILNSSERYKTLCAFDETIDLLRKHGAKE